MTRHSVAQKLFQFSAIVLVIGYSVAVGRYQFFPYALIRFAKQSVVDLFSERNTITRTRPDHFLKEARYPGSGVTRILADRMAPGLTLLQGFFGDTNEMRLIRHDGSIVRRWPVAFSTLVKSTSHIRTDYLVPKSDWNIEVHGAALLPDGSIVFNFEHAALVKIDRCGTPQWILDRMTHHSVERSAGGGFVVPAVRYIESTDVSPVTILTPPYFEETLLKVSDQGDVVAELSLPGLIFDNDLEASILFANGMRDLELQKSPGKLLQEITHLNDVEELGAGIARHFPQFAAGDLLVSERDYNLVMVIDPLTQRVKWHQRGPWMKQHDPDFTPDGLIRILSNNSDGTDDGTILGGSTLLEVDPKNGRTVRVFGGLPTEPMYTRQRGKQQRLDNGNALIAETEAGRVIEIDPRGGIVWEFVNAYDDSSVALITQATRYPPDYFTVRDWACP